MTLYFAYASNMDPVQMAVRCPTSRALGPAYLPDHRLTFVRDSPAWGGGVGSVEPASGEVVWGVLWDLSSQDEAALDVYEGVEQDVYRKEPVEVRTSNGSVSTWLYLVVDPQPKAPSQRYLHALVRGATAFGLPEDYVEQLRAGLRACVARDRLQHRPGGNRMKFDDTLEISSALAIFAHPDDNEWNAGGTIASWVRQGVEVNLVLTTNGASGTTDKTMTRERLTEIRKQEQQEAADTIGVRQIVWLDFEDGYLYPDLELRKAVAREIRRFRPDVLFTHSTERIMADIYANHPDHIATGEVVLRSINPDASSGLMFPELWHEEGFEPYLPKAVFIGTFGEGPVFTDIGDTVDLKIKALHAHRSQIADPEEVSAFVRERFAQVGKKAGSSFAESFRVLRTG